MVGLEALSMQGLPVDKLLLTRETEDQLADLAGNAMSTTVVGACMLAALVIGKKLLMKGDETESYEEKAGRAFDARDNARDAMDIDGPASSSRADVESRISGEEQLIERPLDLSIAADWPLPALLADAQRSARLCDCEGRSDMTSRTLSRCQDCDSTTCVKCGGRPEHNLAPIDLVAHPRLAPASFARELKVALPMSLSVLDVTGELLDRMRDEMAGAEIPDKMWTQWRTAVLRATAVEQRFVELKRQEIWVASYRSPVGSMELLLHPQQTEWLFFATADEKEPANSEIRKILDAPVGRFRCRDGLLDGSWEFALPRPSVVKVAIKGVGEVVQAWQARLGLLGQYSLMTVFPKLSISVPEDSRSSFDRDISGVYTLLDKCGTACNSLHRKEAGEDDASLPPLFLFLDPTRSGTPNEDSFVFSIDKRRYQFGETRPIVCKLSAKWRQTSVTGEDVAISCHTSCVWAKAETVSLQVSSFVPLE